MRRICPLLLAALMLLLPAGCGLAGFAYELAPRIAVRYADDYLQLNNRQEAKALELFRERHAMHARDELPRYHAFLADTRQRINGRLSRDDVDAILDEARALYQLAVERTLPSLSELLVMLEPAQLAQLQKRLEKDAARDRKRMQEDDRARQLENTLEDVEEWLGSLTDSQRALITQTLDEMHETRPLWLQWRIENGVRFMDLMDSDPTSAALEEFLRVYWLERRDMPEELRRNIDENIARYREMLVKLDATLSDGQRMHASQRLEKFSKMIADLMPDDVRIATLTEEHAEQTVQQ